MVEDGEQLHTLAVESERSLKSSFLGQLAITYALIAEASEIADELVAGARSSGASWKEIGESSGMTAQGAQQHWGRHTTPS